MACTTDFIEFLCDRLKPLGNVVSRKMMGDYLIYVNEKYVIAACDNTAFIRKHPSIDKLMEGAECGKPYPGAKEAYIIDLNDNRKMLEAVKLLWDSMPYPKSTKRNR